jgi:hypothetical protein
MNKLIGLFVLAMGLASFTLWLIFLGAGGVLGWLDAASPRTASLLANWGWLGSLLAAVPSILQSKKNSSSSN